MGSKLIQNLIQSFQYFVIFSLFENIQKFSNMENILLLVLLKRKIYFLFGNVVGLPKKKKNAVEGSGSLFLVSSTFFLSHLN